MKILHRLKAKTPSKWRKIGNGLVAGATFGSSLAFLMDEKPLAYIVFGLGIVGKFLTNFTQENE